MGGPASVTESTGVETALPPFLRPDFEGVPTGDAGGITYLEAFVAEVFFEAFFLAISNVSKTFSLVSARIMKVLTVPRLRDVTGGATVAGEFIVVTEYCHGL